MSSRDHQNERDYRDHPPRKSPYFVVIVVLVAGVAFGGMALVGIAGWLLTVRTAPVVAPPAAVAPPVAQDDPVLGPIDPKPAPAKVFTKKEFEGLVLNKTKDQIIAAVGRPDTTTDQVARPAPGVISFLKEYWYFRERVMNPDTAKPYTNVRLYIDTSNTAYRIDYP